MKKLIFVAVLAIAASIYQPAKAQVSFSLNIGRPVVYEPVYYGPGYYTPTRYVYINRNNYVHRNYKAYPSKRVVVYRQPYVQHRVYRTSYARPVARPYVSHNYNERAKFNHVRSNHGRKH